MSAVVLRTVHAGIRSRRDDQSSYLNHKDKQLIRVVALFNALDYVRMTTKRKSNCLRCNLCKKLLRCARNWKVACWAAGSWAPGIYTRCEITQNNANFGRNDAADLSQGICFCMLQRKRQRAQRQCLPGIPSVSLLSTWLLSKLFCAWNIKARLNRTEMWRERCFLPQLNQCWGLLYCLRHSQR